MPRSRRVWIVVCLLALLAVFSMGVPASGQGDLFDEPLVTGELDADPLADTQDGGLQDGGLGEIPIDPREQYMQKMAAAEALMQQEDWAGAVESFNEIILSIRRDPRAMFNRGICFRELGATELAISSVSMAIVTPGAGIEEGLLEKAHLLRGELYLDTGRYREAGDDFTQAAQMNPSNPEPHFYQGKALLRLVVTSFGQGMDASGQASLLQAVKSLERAISIRDDYGEAYMERGRVLFRLRQVEYAVEDYQRAVELLGLTSEASAELGVSLAFRASQESYQPDPDEAKIVQDYRDSISALDHFLSGAQLGEKSAPWETRDPLKTRPENVLLSRAETRFTLANEVAGEARQQLFQAAMADVDELLQHDVETEDEARAYSIRGNVLRMTNQFDAAVRTLTRAIRLYAMTRQSPSDTQLRRGICYYYLGKFDLARQDFQAASVIPSNPYGYEPRAMLWTGLVEAQSGNYEDAIRNYTRAIASASSRYTTAYLNRGLAYMNVGRFEQALEDFDVILRQDPDNDQVQKYRELATQQL